MSIELEGEREMVKNKANCGSFEQSIWIQHEMISFFNFSSDFSADQKKFQKRKAQRPLEDERKEKSSGIDCRLNRHSRLCNKRKLHDNQLNILRRSDAVEFRRFSFSFAVGSDCPVDRLKCLNHDRHSK